MPVPFYTAKETEKEKSQEINRWGKETCQELTSPAVMGTGASPKPPPTLINPQHKSE